MKYLSSTIYLIAKNIHITSHLRYFEHFIWPIQYQDVFISILQMWSVDTQTIIPIFQLWLWDIWGYQFNSSVYSLKPFSRYGPRMPRQPPVRAATKKSDKFSFKFRRLDMLQFHLFFGLLHLLCSGQSFNIWGPFNPTKKISFLPKYKD